MSQTQLNGTEIGRRTFGRFIKILVKKEKEMATNFYFRMTMVDDKMADPFFSKQEDEK